MINPGRTLLKAAFDALVADMTERENDLVLQSANPRQVMEYCQQALPRLDDSFCVAMKYASVDLMLEFHHDYIALRNRLLSDLESAQLVLSVDSRHSL
jgi:hypothetical protein